MIAAISLPHGLCLAASFDCNSATTSVEKRICAEPVVSQLDEKLSKTYREALRSVADPAGLKRDQNKWLRDVRDKCSDSACLEKTYRSRLAVLQDLVEHKSILCGNFQFLLDHYRLGSYQVKEQEIEQNDYNYSIPNVDVDGDKVPDKILLFHSGSGSLIPADYDRVTLILSSTGEEFTVEMQRFYIIRYKAKYYIVATNIEGENGPVFEDIMSMDHLGIKRLCCYRRGLHDWSSVRRKCEREE